MARVSMGPRYYKSKEAWYANLGGERVLLVRGPERETKARAKELYDAEVAARKVEVAGDRNTVWAVLNAYLANLEDQVVNQDASPGHLRIARERILPFNEACGTRAVRDLRPQHLT